MITLTTIISLGVNHFTDFHDHLSVPVCSLLTEACVSSAEVLPFFLLFAGETVSQSVQQTGLASQTQTTTTQRSLKR